MQSRLLYHRIEGMPDAALQLAVLRLEFFRNKVSELICFSIEVYKVDSIVCSKEEMSSVIYICIFAIYTARKRVL